MKVEVKVLSKDSIKPSSPTADHLRHYQLSFLDQLQPLIFMPLVLFYPKDDRTDANLRNEEQRDRIKTSLSDALTRFHPLAGRVKDNLYVDCNDEGVHYVEAEATCKLSEFLDNPIPAELNKFLPYELDDVNELPAAIQLTFFSCGGLVIGLLMSHRVSDALSFFMFLRSWSVIARGDHHDHHHSDTTSHPPMDAATLFPPKHLAGLNPNIVITKEKIVTKRFVFDASAIATLRDKYSTDNATGIEYPCPTRVEALSAFMWSRFMASTQPKDDPENERIYTILHAVNLRPRTDPPLPCNYFGNIYTFAISVPSKDAEDGFYGIVKPVREAIKKVDAEFVKKLQQGDEYLKFLRERCSNVVKGEIISFAITSLCRFPVYEADFGWGKPAWVTSATWTFKNVVSLFDTKSGDGIEAWVNLKQEDMAKFQTDKELLAYVSPAN